MCNNVLAIKNLFIYVIELYIMLDKYSPVAGFCEYSKFEIQIQKCLHFT